MTTTKSALHLSDQAISTLMSDMVGLAAAHWRSLEDRPAYPVTTGAETMELFSRPWAEEGIGNAVLVDFDAIAARSRPSGGRFFGYVFGSGEPVGAMAELLVAALNQNVTSWRSAPAAATIERTVVGWLAAAVGCSGFQGSLCGGGSIANLMGLAMAREARLPANEDGARPGVVYASKEVHFSIPKAVALLGLGRSSLRLVDTDESLRIRPDALRQAISDDRRAGRVPLAIVATLGSVVSGAIDPIVELAAIARREGLWLHGDGAYGALAALAAPEAFEGIELLDSLSLDAHKWLYQTADCSCLLYRDAAAARAAFSQNADYVRVFTENPVESFVFFEESIELTRRSRALKLWMSLQYHGRQAFRSAIETDLGHARLLAEAIRSHAELELVAPVSLSAVCFRHRSKDNEAILRRVIARGRVYLSNASIGGRFALRACFVNHRTSESDALLIVDEVLAAGRDVNG